MLKIYHKITKIIVIIIFSLNYNLASADSIKKVIFLKETFNIKELKLIDYEKNIFLISEKEAEYFIINFWASWCAPCIKEMKSLNLLQKSNQNIRVITISEDSDIEDSKKFFLKNNYEYLEKYFDENKNVINKFLVRGLPTTFIADKDFNVFAKVEGIIEWESKKFKTWLFSN